jgi:hypothetical protein
VKQILFIIAICCLAGNIFPQKDPEKLKAKVDSLKKLGREALIKLAADKKSVEGFDPKGYDRILVKAFEDKLIVEFGLSITLIDGTCYYDRVWVALAGSGSGEGVQGDCDKPKYHSFTDKEKKKIRSVFDAINKSDEIGHLKDNKIPADSHMTITEKMTHYYVEMSDWSTYSHYEVNKLTGKISNANHKHYAHSDNEKDDFEILK